MKGVEGLVSCVTPVYNGENYLGGMLDSLLEQTYPNVELILVDDGSTDRTLELAEGYLARFAQKGYDCRIIHAPHQNASAALNRGLALVRGEYLIWPDSDDVLQPESIQKRVDFLREHPDYHCVRSLMYYFGGNAAQGKQAESVGSLEKEDLFFDLLEGRTFVCCGCYMLKTEDFFSIYPKRRIPEYEVGQNFQMLLPYLYRYRCPTIAEQLYGVYLRPDGHSRRVRTPEEERIRYKNFERLVDELAGICGITGILERRRILCWKLERRRKLAKQQGRRLQAAAATAELFLCGRSRLHRRLFPWLKRWSSRTMERSRRRSIGLSGKGQCYD